MERFYSIASGLTDITRVFVGIVTALALTGTYLLIGTLAVQVFADMGSLGVWLGDFIQGSMTLIALGQAIYIVPLAYLCKRNDRPAEFGGLLIGALIVTLLNILSLGAHIFG